MKTCWKSHHQEKGEQLHRLWIITPPICRSALSSSFQMIKLDGHNQNKRQSEIHVWLTGKSWRAGQLNWPAYGPAAPSGNYSTTCVPIRFFPPISQSMLILPGQLSRSAFFQTPSLPPPPSPTYPSILLKKEKKKKKKERGKEKKKLKSWEGEHEKGNRELQNRGGLIRDVAKLEDGR